MSLPTPDVSQVTKKLKEQKVYILQKYIQKIIDAKYMVKSKQKILKEYNKIQNRPFRIIGMITDTEKDKVKIQVLSCQHFKSIQYRPKEIDIYDIPADFMSLVVVDKVLSIYIKLSVTSSDFCFSFRTNKHNKIRLPRNNDFDDYFDPEDDDYECDDDDEDDEDGY